MRKILCICIYLLFTMSLNACSNSKPMEDVENNPVSKLEINESDISDAVADIKTDIHGITLSTEVSTLEPTILPTLSPTVTSTPEPTAAPTPEPTVAPTPEPTAAPTPEPTVAPPEPTVAPTPEPTAAPTPEPTAVPTPEPTVAPTPDSTATPTIVCEHSNSEIHYLFGPPTCTKGAYVNEYCLDCGVFLKEYSVPTLPHEKDEDYWNSMNICANSGTGAFIPIPCKHCGVNTENRPVTATHNFVPSKISQYVEVFEGSDGYEGSTLMYEHQEYECTGCGKTYAELLNTYLLVDGKWIEL